MLFPLENFKSKEEVRKIAEEYELKIAHKKDSQEVCFIPDNDYGKFLKEKAKIKTKKGKIVLKDGTILGEHEGLIFYTVGQRKGLGISYEKPLYVLKLDHEKNELIVGTEKELYTKELYANELNFLLEKNINLSKPIEVMAKIRYRAQEAKATLELIQEGEKINDKEKQIVPENRKNMIAKVVFEEPQRAVTPGQSVVFYLGDVVLGGGKIIF